MKKLSVVLFCAVILTAGVFASTTVSVEIDISNEALQMLKESNSSLYGFKGVRSSGLQGQPLAWLVTDNYLSINRIAWTGQYGLYDSCVKIQNGVDIVPANSIRVDLGDSCIITCSGIQKQQGQPGAITVIDQCPQIPTFGLMQSINGRMNPFCAFQGIPQMKVELEPAEYVVFFFATQKNPTGTVIEQALGPAIQIDLTGVTSRKVIFDKNGWNDNTEPWVKQIPAGASLAPYLIIN